LAQNRRKIAHLRAESLDKRNRSENELEFDNTAIPLQDGKKELKVKPAPSFIHEDSRKDNQEYKP